jgi:hypothetical protein
MTFEEKRTLVESQRRIEALEVAVRALVAQRRGRPSKAQTDALKAFNED